MINLKNVVCITACITLTLTPFPSAWVAYTPQWFLLVPFFCKKNTHTPAWLFLMGLLLDTALQLPLGVSGFGLIAVYTISQWLTHHPRRFTALQMFNVIFGVILAVKLLIFGIMMFKNTPVAFLPLVVSALFTAILGVYFQSKTKKIQGFSF